MSQTVRTKPRKIAATGVITKTVQFTLNLPQAKAVGIAGTFNGWDPVLAPMRRGFDGCWSATVKLSPGRYEYLFVADGNWIRDAKARETAPNPFGGVNSVISL